MPNLENTETRPETNDRRFRIIFLGAGFSHAAGLPLGGKLWENIMRFADHEFGRDNIIRRDLAQYLEYQERVSGIRQDERTVDFEKFVSFLDIEHSLGLLGSDTWSTSGNRSQIVIKWLIGKILWDQQTSGRSSRPKVYRQFAERLRPGDIVLTFNYDTILEESLDAISQPYRLFPMRFSSIGKFSNSVNSEREDEVLVIKLHGSLDWFDRRPYEARLAIRAITNPPTSILDPVDPVFGRGSRAKTILLTDGPRNPDDQLQYVHRVVDPDTVYTSLESIFVGTPPLILAPSYHKILYTSWLSELWAGLGRTGGASLGMGIIGFSLPEHDGYIRQILYSVTRNYTDSWWDERLGNMLKLPLRLIDYRPDVFSQTEYRTRYQFLNWDRTEAFLHGLNQKAVDFLFAESRP